MANKARGEISVKYGSKTYTLALTLGAMAQIEDEFGVDSFEQAFNLEKPSGRKLKAMMLCLFRGNGHAVTPEVEAGVGHTTLPDFIALFAQMMALNGMSEAPAGGEPAAPLAGPSAGASG